MVTRRDREMKMGWRWKAFILLDGSRGQCYVLNCQEYVSRCSATCTECECRIHSYGPMVLEHSQAPTFFVLLTLSECTMAFFEFFWMSHILFSAMINTPLFTIPILDTSVPIPASRNVLRTTKLANPYNLHKSSHHGFSPHHHQHGQPSATSPLHPSRRPPPQPAILQSMRDPLGISNLR